MCGAACGVTCWRARIPPAKRSMGVDGLASGLGCETQGSYFDVRVSVRKYYATKANQNMKLETR